MKIAIIGAGMSGLSAARTLAEAGADCTVFEKSRGVGGRMATRRVNELQFDHGAQYFTARGPRFQSRLAHWKDQGVVAEWLPGKWVGSPTMTAPARSLAEGLQVIREYRVTTLAGGPGCWLLLSDDSPDNPIRETSFDAVVMALPTPQVAPLAASAGIRFIELERVRYAPCITLLLAYDKATGLREPSFSPPDGPIGWIARNDTKPGRSAVVQTLVVHATPVWSEEHLEDTDQGTTGTLLRALRPYIGAVKPVFRMLHRWRYARVEHTAGVPYVWDPARQVGACGDWGGGPRVEAAFESGEAMATALLQAELTGSRPKE